MQERIKEINSRLEQILDYYNIDFSKGNIRCINPSHRDKNPSMGLDKTKADHPRLHCFSCDCFYDALDIVAIQEGYENRSFEAIKKAEEILNLKNCPSVLKITPKQGKEQQFLEEILKKKEHFISDGHKSLLTSLEDANNKKQCFYLLRGLNETVIKRFRLGFYIRGNNKSNSFYNYIIPFSPTSCNYLLTTDKRESLPENMGKYHKPAGQKDILFNKDSLFLEKQTICKIIFITEGCFDALSVEEVTNEAHAVALLGLNTNLLKNALQEIDKEDFVFIVALDNDEAGRKESDKLKIWFKENDFLFIDGVSSYKDYNDFLVGDRERFKDFINAKIKQSIDWYLNNENYVIKKEFKLENKLIQYPIIETCFLLMLFVHGKELLNIIYETNFKPSFLQNEDCRNIFRLLTKSFIENGYLLQELFLDTGKEQYKKDYTEFWEYCEKNFERIEKLEEPKEDIFLKLINIIKERAKKNIYNELAKKMINCVENNNLNNIDTEMQYATKQITQLNTTKSSFSLTAFLETWLTKKEGITGLNCGFPMFEKTIDGLNKGSLIIIAGRPGMGKTTFGLCAAVNCCYYSSLENIQEKGGNVVFFSMEMTQEEIYKKLFKRFLKSDYKYYENTANNKKEEVQKIAQKFEKYITEIKFDIEIPVTRYYEDLEQRILYWTKFKQKNVFVIDHLHLLTVKNSLNRALDLSFITASLKSIAIQYDVTIILLAQLNRTVESKESKKPNMSSLRDSGGIEENADIVCFLYRAGYYCREYPEFQQLSPQEQKQVLSQAELIISKNRNGETTSIPLTFEGEYSNFYETPEWQQQSLIDISNWGNKKIWNSKKNSDYDEKK